MRGRARALPFFRNALEDRSLPPPGAVIHMDGAGMMLPSRGHRYRCYMMAVCKGSNYRRFTPGHTMTTSLARQCLEIFLADLTAKMGLSHRLKPQVIVTDQGSAFMSHEFVDFLSADHIRHRTSATYTPQQNSTAERLMGTTFGYARTLLIAAHLPASMHPFAVQCATWILNRLPQPSRNQLSPYCMLTRATADIRFLRVFGCLCRVTIPDARRVGDKHFADRGAAGLYLGPSERSPAAIVWVLSNSTVVVSPHVVCYEDNLPGFRGDPASWDDQHMPDEPTSAATPSPPVAPVPVAPSAAPPPPSQYDGDGFALNSYDSFSPPPSPPPRPVTPRSRTAHESSPRRSAPQHGGVDGGGSIDGAGNRPSPQLSQRAAHIINEHAPNVPHQSLSPRDIQAVNREGSAKEGYQAHILRGRLAATAEPGITRATTRQPAQATSFFTHFDTMLKSGYSKDIAAHFASVASNHSICACYSMPDLPHHVNQDCTACGGTGYIKDSPCYTCGISYNNHTNCAYASSVGPHYTVEQIPPDGDDAFSYPIFSLATTKSSVATTTVDLGDITIPKSAHKALQSPHAVYWYEAIMKELKGLLALNTWTTVKSSSLPSNANVMRCHFIFTVKRQRDGSLDKFKCRLVADGNTQKYGVDFDRIFSTVVKSTTIRMVLIIACSKGWHLSAIDIAQAYLQAELSEDLYMMVPPLIPLFPYQPLIDKDLL